MGYCLVASSLRLRGRLNKWFMRVLIGGVKLPAAPRKLRHSVKFLVRVAFENTVGVVQNSADITAKEQYIRVNYNIATTILIEKYHTGYSSALGPYCGFIAIPQTSHLHLKIYEIGVRQVGHISIIFTLIV